MVYPSVPGIQVRTTWWGRMGQPTAEACNLFYSQTVRPCIDTEPGAGLKEAYLQKLLDYLSSDPNTNHRDLDMIQQICSGKLQRHPALHGVAC